MTEKEFRVHIALAVGLILACVSTLDVWPFGAGGPPLAVLFLGIFAVQSLVFTLRLLLS